MTGTGTQADPYRPESWEDFLSVKDSSSTQYIKFADSANKVIDFNDIQPEGFTSPITMSGYIDFNGWELRNMKFVETVSCFQYATISSTNYPIYEFKNAKFTNFNWLTAVASSYFLNDDSSSSARATAPENVSIYGNVVSQGMTLYISKNSKANYKINLNAEISTTYSNTTLYMSENNNSNLKSNCNIKIIVGSNITVNLGKMAYSLIQGSFAKDTGTVLTLGSNSASNVILVTTSADISCAGAVSVYNKDLAPNATDTSSLIGCTTVQLKDPAYLKSIGFDIYGQVVT